MAAAARILIVDDEDNIRSSLQEMLTYAGYRVVAVESGEAAVDLIAAGEKFDLALIDLKLEGIGGMEVLGELRQQSPDTVAIVLTAHASLETAVEALRYGAHDYLFKPCKPSELQESIRRGLVDRQPELRQQALIQQLNDLADNLEVIRASVTGQQALAASPDFSETAASTKPLPPTVEPPEETRRFLKHGGLVVDYLRYIITLNGQLLDLSSTEFDLLAYLIKQAPRVVSAQELTREVKKYEADEWGAAEAVRQNIYRIRQKIKEVNNNTDIIRTVRGVGYAITE
ncbi:MAG TPA: response regulator transcription factor [Anaerolineae bacterium]|nr:response regulator transcription factor [Anaerolineae bacterium]HMR62626.1 response regulator transcription factor [Anaerolineae bacterium]